MRNGSKKIQLIRCPIDNPNLGADQWNMPLDLIVIGSSVNSDCSVEILDGTLIGLEGILKKIDPSSDCVGLTYTALSSKSLKIIASTAKSNGSFIIIGGQPAMASAESLVLEDFIAAVCVGDGEPTMKAISNQIGNKSFHKELIPNLLFKISRATGMFNPKTFLNISLHSSSKKGSIISNDGIISDPKAFIGVPDINKISSHLVIFDMFIRF